MIDLRAVAMEVSSSPRCKQTSSTCETNELSGIGYCAHGECWASLDASQRRCVCTPGWGGLSP